MFDLTSLDYIYIVVLLASTIWATIRGGVYETIATLSWVAAAIAARFASPWLDGVFQTWFKLQDSTVVTLVASYFLVFFVILLLVGFVNQKLRDKIQESMMNVTDHTLGVIFGIIRGIIVMGIVYWIAVWYYSDIPRMPDWIANARTRPIMQLTAVKLDDWFVPGAENKLLARDVAGTKQADEIYKNLINPAVATVGDIKSGEPRKKTEPKTDAKPSSTVKPDNDTGYKSSERTALENQLLQIETSAHVEEKE
ncbi:MAG: CvpA family protein [Alphaproteobacteria bacterium]|nr:CvpA family protein [Alphaproteobacteria bacterium]